MELNARTQKEQALLAHASRRGLTVMRIGSQQAVRVFGLGVDVRAITLGTLRLEDLEPVQRGGRHARR